MRRFWLAWLLLPLALTAADLEISVDREDRLYAVGAPATFTIRVTAGAAPATGKVSVVLRENHRRELRRLELPLTDGQARFAQALDEPGFLLCEASWPQGKGKPLTGRLAVAVEPSRIAPAQAEPDDFDAFWRAGRRQVRELPEDAVVTPLPKFSREQYACYKLSLANLHETRAWGFLAVPQGEGPFPLVVRVPGANLRAPSRPATQEAGRGAIELLLSAHAHDPNLPPEAFAELVAAGLGNYIRQGAPDREAYYYRRAILGADRLLDYVCDNYPWDGKHCVVVGHSQGGAFALFLGGLNARVSAVAAAKPAMCDHAGYTRGRATGWPNLASYQKPELQAATLAMSGYFDGAFFARRIKVPAIVTVGYLDAACPPSSVLAAYNQLAGPKRLFHEPDAGHSAGKGAYDAYLRDTWLPGQLGRREPAPDGEEAP